MIVWDIGEFNEGLLALVSVVESLPIVQVDVSRGLTVLLVKVDIQADWIVDCLENAHLGSVLE